MYLDLVVLVVLLVFVIIYSKRFQTYIFGFGVIDILFRILNIINGFIPFKEVRKIIKTYTPPSVPDVINVVIMAIFLFYVVKIFLKRKKL